MTADPNSNDHANGRAFDPDYAPDNPFRVDREGIDPGMKRRLGVLWGIRGENGKIPKRPDDPSANAKSNDAQTWGPFADALDAAADHPERGVGFPLEQPGHPYVALDIDIPEGGDWVPDLRQLDGATAEYSPSGNLRVYLRGVETPDWWTNQKGDTANAPEIVAYDDSGYVTVTGDLLPGFDAEITDTPQDDFEAFLRAAWTAYNPDADEEAAPWTDTAQDAASAASGRATTGGRTHSRGDDVDLDVTDVAPAGTPVGERVAHPVHGSETGTNFKIDEDRETFRCWRHDVTGNAMHYLGMDAGIIDCGDWKHGDLDAETWRDIFDHAREQGHDVPEPTGGAPGGERFDALDQLDTQGDADAEGEGEGEGEGDGDDDPDSGAWGGRSWLQSYRHYVEQAADAGDELSQKQKRNVLAKFIADERTFMARHPENDPDKVPLWEYDPESGVYDNGAVGRLEAELTELGEIIDFGDADRRAVVKNIRRLSFTDPETFDAGDYDESLIAVENGVVSVEDGEFYDHSPDYRLRSQLPHTFDPSADCPNIDSFLTEVTGGDEIAKQTLYEWIGYCLVDGYPIHSFLLIHGDGGNGKGVFFKLLKHFLGGSENVSNVGLTKIVADDRFSLAQLDGKLANLDGDIPGKTITTEQLGAVKKLSAGDEKQVEHKNQDPFTLRNSAKLAFAANKPPMFFEASDSVARRLIDIEFPVRFEGTDRAKTERELRDELFNGEEMSGLLNRALDAVRDLLDRNQFTLQAETDEAARFARYMDNADSIRAFADLCLTERSGHVTTKAAVYHAYVGFATANGYEPTDDAMFWRELGRKAGITPEKKSVRMDDERVQSAFGLWFTDAAVKHLSEDHAASTLAVTEKKRPDNTAAAKELLDRVRDRERPGDDDAQGDEDGDERGPVEPSGTATPRDGGRRSTVEVPEVPADAKGIEADKKRLLGFLAERQNADQPTPGTGEVCARMAERYDWNPERAKDVLDRLLDDGRARRERGGYAVD